MTEKTCNPCEIQFQQQLLLEFTTLINHAWTMNSFCTSSKCLFINDSINPFVPLMTGYALTGLAGVEQVANVCSSRKYVPIQQGHQADPTDTSKQRLADICFTYEKWLVGSRPKKVHEGSERRKTQLLTESANRSENKPENFPSLPKNFPAIENFMVEIGSWSLLKKYFMFFVCFAQF